MDIIEIDIDDNVGPKNKRKRSEGVQNHHIAFICDCWASEATVTLTRKYATVPTVNRLLGLKCANSTCGRFLSVGVQFYDTHGEPTACGTSSGPRLCHCWLHSREILLTKAWVSQTREGQQIPMVYGFKCTKCQVRYTAYTGPGGMKPYSKR